MVELTWDYGRHYERHWLGDSRRGRAHDGSASASAGGGGGGGGGGGAEGRVPSNGEAEQWSAVGGAGGGGGGLLGEEAATAEAREQLLAAEELLPWGCVEPSWGARRCDHHRLH